MNFLVAKILIALQISRGKDTPETREDEDEEIAFWIFTMMLESILPLDYYSNMIGVLID